MSNSTAANIFGKGIEQGNISVTRSYKNYASRILETGEFPLLPNALVDYKFSEAEYPIEIRGTKTSLKFPKVNEILTEYCRKCIQTYSTIEFIELVNKHSSPTDIYTFKDNKLEYAISLYNTIYNLPDTLDSARDTLAYYLTASFDLIGLAPDTAAKLLKLRNSLKSIETEYSDKLIREVLPHTVIQSNGKPLDAAIISWFNSQRAGKVLNKEAADWFVNRANEEMKLDVDVEFAKDQIKAIMFNADPIISDARFRMSLADARWNEYDETIKKEVAFYNQKFAKISGFVPLDWRWVKAMVWTEVMAGPNESKGQWQQRPMQIGVGSDPSLGVVSNEKDDANLIVSAETRNEIRSNHFGINNVKAGIAALYYKAIEGTKTEPRKVGSRPVIDNATIETYVFKQGDTVESVANKLLTTPDNIFLNTVYLTDSNGQTVLEGNNPVKLNDQTTRRLQGGAILKFQKAHSERYITDWRDWMTTIKNYNKNADSTSTKGDSEYVPKVLRAYQIIKSRTPQ